MNVQFQQCDYAEIESAVVNNHKTFVSPTDSFGENNILKSNHYRIVEDNQMLGYCSVLNGKTMTQFFLEKKFRGQAQELFAMARKLESVHEAMVATCDEFFLSLCLDVSDRITRQAYFFRLGSLTVPDAEADVDYQLAQPEDAERILSGPHDFSEQNLAQNIADAQIYIGRVRNEIVGYGVFERSKIVDGCVSIGMFTLPDHRMKGIAKKTLRHLADVALSENLQPIAGCYYFNHNSKKSLESIGMVSNTRLLRFAF